MASEISLNAAIVAIIFIVGTAVGVIFSILFLILKKKVEKAKDLRNKKLPIPDDGSFLRIPSIGDSFIDLSIDISPVDDNGCLRDDILSIDELGKSDELGTIERFKLAQKYLETDVPCTPIKDAHHLLNKGLDTKVDLTASNQSVKSSNNPAKQTASSCQSNPAIHMAAPGKINKKNVLRGESKQSKASKDLRAAKISSQQYKTESESCNSIIAKTSPESNAAKQHGIIQSEQIDPGCIIKSSRPSSHNIPNEWQTCKLSSSPSSHEKNIIVIKEESDDEDNLPLGTIQFY